VTPGVGIERRNADEAVHAGFGFEIPVRVGALDGKRRTLDPRAFTGLLVDHLGSVVAPLAPAQVHPLQHLRPILRFQAAGPRMQSENGVTAIVLAAEHALELQAGDCRLDLLDCVVRLFGGVRVFDGEIEIDLGVFQIGLLFAPALEGHTQGGPITKEFLGLFGVLPEIRRGGFLVQLT